MKLPDAALTPGVETPRTMLETGTHPPTSESERRATSFLVRLWKEPGAAPEEQEVVRGFIRSLASGEELYVNDPAELADALVRAFRSSEAGRESRGAERLSGSGGR